MTVLPLRVALTLLKAEYHRNNDDDADISNETDVESVKLTQVSETKVESSPVETKLQWTETKQFSLELYILLAFYITLIFFYTCEWR